MKKQGKSSAPQGPSQRQLRAGELVRHALAEILREETLTDPALSGVSITVTEARVSPDLRHAHIFVEPLGGVRADEVVSSLNKVSKFLRGRLGHTIDMKFTPDLKFLHDQSFNNATYIDSLFDDPRVKADLIRDPEGNPDGTDDGA
jgi:ribosome-binding factor A